MDQKQDNQVKFTPPILPSESDGGIRNVPVAPPVLPVKDDVPDSYPSFLQEESVLEEKTEDEDSSGISENGDLENNVSAPILPIKEISSGNMSEDTESEEKNQKSVEEEGEYIVSEEAKKIEAQSEVTEYPRIPSHIVDEVEKIQNDSEENTLEATLSQNEKLLSQQTRTVETEQKDVENKGTDEDIKVTDYKSETFLDDLFKNGNECITAPNGSFSVKDDTRMLLALFSNGRFFVSETAKFDGTVLTFEYLARRRHLQIAAPEYVPSVVIGDIYNYASRVSANSFIPPTVDTNAPGQVRMQRDFVAVITKAASQRVSDIHIVVADHTTIMFRVNGLMQTEMEYNKEWGESFVRAAFASADISDSNYAQNEYQAAQKLGRTPLRGSGGRLVLPRNVLGIRLQFNPIAFGTRYVVMRLLYAEDDVRESSNLEALGFTPRETNIFYQLRAVPTGMIVISGPTGSGKSTTLQRNMISMLQERNYEINLITVEDPPEYPIPGARQMPVTNADTEGAKDVEFTKALSAALRSDPDALMIGEIRALAAADLAFRGALSGHNVWTTLHANSAPAILLRLKDIGVEDFKLQDPSLIRGLMAQRLFRKLCPECRVRALEKLDNPSVQRLRRAFGDIALEQSYLKGPGCEACDFRGVKGRTVVAEFVLPDATYLDLAIRGESRKAMNYWINDLNGITLREAALSRMLAGIIDIEEVERWTGFLDQQVLA